MTAHARVATRAESLVVTTQRVFSRSADAPDSDCIWWTGARNGMGYGVIRYAGIGGLALTHRVVAEWALGPIPEELVVDHTCHSDSTCIGGPSCVHRRCVNPDHLELVTGAENSRRSWPARKPRCVRGHEFTEANTEVARNGRRACRVCRRASAAALRRRRGIPARVLAS